MARWNHVPEVPIRTNPLFSWPPRPGAVLRWYAGAWLPVSVSLVIVALAWAAWWLTVPAPAEAARPGAWMLAIWLRNLVLVTVVAHGLHLVFYRHQLQGTRYKFDPRPFPRRGRAFTFSSQLADNVFWTLASGVTAWSAWEVLVLWAMATGRAPVIAFADAPAWFIAIFFLIPVWESLYFYWMHRLLHTRLFWRFHAIHHRNTDVGPWSGLSMHPVEHVLFFATAAIHFVVPTHPVHVVAHLMFFGLYAITTHTGFEGFFAGGRKRVHLGNFHHQMHHRFFEVNYGSLEIPWDRFFGTFHDGTEDADQRMKQRLAERAKMRSG